MYLLHQADSLTRVYAEGTYGKNDHSGGDICYFSPRSSDHMTLYRTWIGLREES